MSLSRNERIAYFIFMLLGMSACVFALSHFSLLTNLVIIAGLMAFIYGVFAIEDYFVKGPAYLR